MQFQNCVGHCVGLSEYDSPTSPRKMQEIAGKHKFSENFRAAMFYWSVPPKPGPHTEALLVHPLVEAAVGAGVVDVIQPAAAAQLQVVHHPPPPGLDIRAWGGTPV